LKVYPNPARDWLHVEALGQARIQRLRILSLEGQEIARRLANRPVASFAIRLHGLAEALYMLEIQTTEGITILRVQKQ
jgi:hypothetical protein